MIDSPAVAVVFDGAKIPVKVEAKWYHYVAAFFWNLYRKPKVWAWQREQNIIYQSINASLEIDVLNFFRQRGFNCPTCHQAWGMFLSVSFVSMIKTIAKNMRCKEHPYVYDAFLKKNEPLFQRNEDLARWINGL